MSACHCCDVDVRPPDLRACLPACLPASVETDGVLKQLLTHVLLVYTLHDAQACGLVLACQPCMDTATALSLFEQRTARSFFG